ncbi:hypothetical protein [Glycomyces paridis]|uniref:Uncharacterized protein n=1 Tax=Glycomyces paridis TaxID=2126555 RepID=A0A4S8PK03_9ACTN|nr:hypothetical protein [Glycomyces paridis]THV28759.1 hypothetical protein E9998_11715 [Glycomyces paridis]
MCRWSAASLGAVLLLTAAACQGEEPSERASEEASAGAPEAEDWIEAAPSRAAVIDWDTQSLIAIVDGEPVPVPEAGMVSGPPAVNWSPDGGLMTAGSGGTFWQWPGPGEAATPFSCGANCQGAFVADDPEQLYSFNGTEIQRLGEYGYPAAEPVGVGLGTRVDYLDSAQIWGVVDGKLLIGKTDPEERYASAADLWLVDPATGEVLVEATEDFAEDQRFSHVALHHDASRVALTGDGAGYCDPSPGVTVLDTATLAPAEPVADFPAGANEGTVHAADLFYNGTILYAVLQERHGADCAETTPMGVWRHTDGAWEQVAEGDFASVRPLEALDGAQSGAALVVDAGDGACRVVDLPGGEIRADLGSCDVLTWSTPTANEIDLSALSGR